MTKQILILIFACLFGGHVFSQLTTNTNLTPTQLVENVLVGQGIDISNVTYTGAAGAIGQFNATASNVGIGQGVILSTGNVLDNQAAGKKNGPVGPNNTGSATTAWNTAGDNDLSAIIGDQTHDAVVLEFDFIPQGDTIRFNYVFASEEYTEFSGPNSVINDAFAFIISGPGFGTPTNIAVLPGTNTAVSIKNVNDWINTGFYIDNGDGFNGPQFSDLTVVNFDGITVQLTAIAKVTPCVSYHLKIVLADGGDASLDSGVFLEGGSLNSNPSFSFTNDPTFNPLIQDTLISEGCSNGIIRFKRYDEIWNPFVLDFRVLGSATNDLDYSLSANQVVFPANIDEVTIDINSIGDDLVEGIESVILRFPSPFICILDSIDITYNIVDREPLLTNTITGNITCPGDEFEMDAVISGGVPGYDFSWADGTTTSNNKVSPITTQTYLYTVTDTCGTAKTDSAVITVPNFQPLKVDLSNDTTVYCPGSEVELVATGVGGGGSYTYVWDSGESSNTIKDTILSDKSYDVTVYDNCGDSIKGNISVDLDYAAFAVSAFNDTIICSGDTAFLYSLASGGVQPYNYVWETADLTATTLYDGLVSKFVIVTATDSCGIIPATDSVFVTVQKPTAEFDIIAPVPEILEIIYFENASLGNSLTYNWDLGNGQLSNLEDEEATYLFDSIYTISLMVEDDLGCRDAILKQIKIDPPLYYYLPNSFTPDGNGVNDEFVGKGIGIETFEMVIYDRWGIELFSTQNFRTSWDGRSKSGKYVPLGVYVYRVFIIGESGEEIEKIGKVTLLR
jgi:gliding motility-associated-like protein